ncbi:MAG: hypothetical protein KDK26_16780 [Roseivivax sp.]|nr:hypothetical protein [Roseivivax sp.]
MPRFHRIPLVAVLALAALPAAADPCQEEIQALYDGGPMDYYTWGPYKTATAYFAQDGSLKMVLDIIAETPTHMISTTRDSGQWYLVEGLETWTAPAAEGPWTYAGKMQHADADGFNRQMLADQRKNVTEAECLGVVELAGRPAQSYRFITKTDPHEEWGSGWFGGRYAIWVDQETRRIARMETHEFAAHYAPTPSTDIIVNEYTYDPTIAMPPTPPK